MEKRNELLDVMRGIAIILLVLGHAGVCNFWRIWIYAFHMPLFFLISGYFCSDKKNFERFVFGKVKRLYVPFVFYYVLFISFSHFLHPYGLTQFDYLNLRECLRAVLLAVRFRVGAMDLLGHFWFLPVLFFISVLFYLLLKGIHYFSLRKEMVIIGGGIFTILSIVAKWQSFPNPYDVLRVCYYMGFYALGWYVAQNDFFSIRMPKYGLVVSFVILVLFACSSKSIQCNPLIEIIVAIVGIIFVWGFCQEAIRTKKNISLLSYIGKHTMSIYVWHVFCFKCLELLLFHLGLITHMTIGWHGSYPVHSFGWVLLFALVGVLLPIELCNIKNKIIGK